ncbi:hypothetical protein SAMN04487983_106428 [Streptomyces sp. yr375]|uniref:DUF5753 domain-containing protein n=1 Tax=Streptomyces sp. yr375 TaxID=1761906 RepID=UPI0008B6CAA6|nr:DUF5753 domain-containing protein [Streptomyces sp. yr375]SES47612.1 hypothetical protein SAMN04487983_106428 [Streptomyces sp. yr375]
MTQPKHAHLTWDEQLQEGTGAVQGAFLELVRETKDTRSYHSNIIDGDLQTADYARAVLRRVVDFHAIPDDVEDGVAHRTARAQYMGQGGRTYHTLLDEQALRTNMGGVEVMRGQLRHLLDVFSLPGLRLGVIPARAELAVYPGHSFAIFDGELVEVETYASCLSVTEVDAISTYEKAFGLLERSAVYGQEARELIEAELLVLG